MKDVETTVLVRQGFISTLKVGPDLTSYEASGSILTEVGNENDLLPG
jgi:hypothetical protein